MYLRAAIITFVLGVFGAQPSAPAPKDAPMRELPWGQVNFLHSTDTHGWHAGHLQEPSYSADWGDYISFAHHMRARANEDGVDMLVVDTGDRVEGDGLYDASRPPGLYTYDIFKHQEIDVICSGNHEMYKAASSNNEFMRSVPNFKGNYLASNIDIYDNRTGKFVPLAPRYKKFTTKNQGICIAAFGFIYNFQDSSNNTVVTPVQDAIKQRWFQDIIRDKDIDLFLVTGHIGLRQQELKTIFEAIRAQQWDAPIQILGGHTHIRDYAKYDSKAYGLESGRYMETIGFASVSGLRMSNGNNVEASRSKPDFKRRYIDNNLYSYHHHTKLNDTTFPIELGMNVTSQISKARKALSLDDTFGCAPRDLWLARVSVRDEASIFKWIGEEMFPDQFSERRQQARPKLVITNTGAIRFDLFKGPFTRDTIYQVTPFTSGFRYIKNVDYKTARGVLEVLNKNAPILQDLDPSLDPSLLPPPQSLGLATAHNPLIGEESENLRVEKNSCGGPTLDLKDPSKRKPWPEGGKPDCMHEPSEWVKEELLKDGWTGEDSAQPPFQYERSQQRPLKHEKPLTPGYTTHDDLGNNGDDTIHSRIPYVNIPNCIRTEIDFPEGDAEPETVDIVYNEFIEKWLILALRFLGTVRDKEDTSPYFEGQSFTDIMADWVTRHWPCEEDNSSNEF